MPLPLMVKDQDSSGRFGQATFSARWIAGAADDLDHVKILDREYASGKINNVFFGVDNFTISYSCSGSADIFFDSIPETADGMVFAITPGSGNYASGPVQVADPAREVSRDGTSAGNLVMTTRGMQAGDEIFFRVNYREKGDTRGK